jgi:predicted ester cyclase
MTELHEQVRRFYEILWNNYDLDSMPMILHEDLSFWGSLGDIKRGYHGFAEYVDKLYKALGEYRCTIEQLVSEDARVFAKMKFSGIHRGELMGYGPTGKRVTWAGAALFTFKDARIRDIWVLGDLKGIEEQLE